VAQSIKTNLGPVECGKPVNPASALTKRGWPWNRHRTQRKNKQNGSKHHIINHHETAPATWPHPLPQSLPVANHAVRGASEQGFFDRSFENKKQAVEYQKRVKAKFPNAPCCIIDMGRWHDSLGRTIH
jgi:hypothetical protein